MTYEVYRLIFIIAAILSAVMLVVTVLLFFLLNIRSAIGFLTGSAQRRGVEDIRSGAQRQKNQKRAPTTDRVSRHNDRQESTAEREVTARLGNAQTPPQETTVLPAETTVLSENGTPMTTVLQAAPNCETTVLIPETDAEPDHDSGTAFDPVEGRPDEEFRILEAITFVFSDEIVE